MLTPTCGRLGKPIWEQISCWLVEQAENTHQSPMKRNTQSLTASRREKRYRVYRITRFTLLGMDINFLPHFKAICRECLKLGTTESSIGEIVFNVRPSCFECNKYYPSRQQLFVSFYWLLCFFNVARFLKICSKPLLAGDETATALFSWEEFDFPAKTSQKLWFLLRRSSPQYFW